MRIIKSVERESQLPPKLLEAIAIVETGRIDPITARLLPWAWSTNASGVGEVFPDRDAAIAATETKLATGITSVDVGCMQINLSYHPRAFSSLAEAFDPEANVRYAARFLKALYRQTGSWANAAMAYHSQTPDLGIDYLRRVALIWPDGASLVPLDTAGRPRTKAALALAMNKDYTPEMRIWVEQNAVDNARLLNAHGATREGGQRRGFHASARPPRGVAGWHGRGASETMTAATGQ